MEKTAPSQMLLKIIITALLISYLQEGCLLSPNLNRISSDTRLQNQRQLYHQLPSPKSIYLNQRDLALFSHYTLNGILSHPNNPLGNSRF